MFKIAAALDPNYKLSWTMDDAEIVSVKAAIKAELEKITPLPAHTETNTLSASPPRKRSRYLGYLNRRPAVQSTQADRYTSQMNKYLAEDIPEEDKDMVDPLLYWKLHQNQYPDLAMLACRYLHVPASSSPVERVFSIAGRVFRPDRASLSDSRFEKLMFIACNTKQIKK